MKKNGLSARSARFFLSFTLKCTVFRPAPAHPRASGAPGPEPPAPEAPPAAPPAGLI